MRTEERGTGSAVLKSSEIGGLGAAEGVGRWFRAREVVSCLGLSQNQALPPGHPQPQPLHKLVSLNPKSHTSLNQASKEELMQAAPHSSKASGSTPCLCLSAPTDGGAQSFCARSKPELPYSNDELSSPILTSQQLQTPARCALLSRPPSAMSSQKCHRAAEMTFFAKPNPNATAPALSGIGCRECSH